MKICYIFLIQLLDEYSDFIIKNKSKFMKLYYSYDINGVCPIDYLFSEGSLIIY